MHSKLVRAKQEVCRKKTKKWSLKRERDTRRRAGGEYTHIPEALWEGAGSLTVSPSGAIMVKVPEYERWRLRPAHVEPLPDTSLSSAACGFETSPRFVGHHELHPGKSIALEAQTQNTMTSTRETYIDILVGKLFQWQLTISLNTSVFELPFKLHAVVSIEDPCALKLSV